jgi:hypothetical protein
MKIKFKTTKYEYAITSLNTNFKNKISRSSELMQFCSNAYECCIIP